MYKKAFECCTSKENKCTECPLYAFFGCKEELLSGLRLKTVWELKIDWATDDDRGCTTEIYATEERAIKAFNFEIIQSMQDYGCFDEQTGELEKGWVLEKSDKLWDLWEDGFYTANRCTITITEKEIID